MTPYGNWWIGSWVVKELEMPDLRDDITGWFERELFETYPDAEILEDPFYFAVDLDDAEDPDLVEATVLISFFSAAIVSPVGIVGR